MAVVELKDYVVLCPDDVSQYQQLKQAKHNYKDVNDQLQPNLQINGPPVQFETHLFIGQMLFWIRDESNNNSQVFEGKRRRSVLVIQGRFKDFCSFNDIDVGQEFKQNLNLPKNPIIMQIFKIFLYLLQKANPSYKVGDLQNQFYLLNPLIAVANIVCISTQEEAKNIETFLVEQVENMLLLDDLNLQYKSQPLDPEKRRLFFCREENRRKFRYDPSLVYTFCFNQHAIDFNTFQVPINVLGSYQNKVMGNIGKIRLSDYLNNQPIKIMGKHNVLNSYLWNFDLYPGSNSYNNTYTKNKTFRS